MKTRTRGGEQRALAVALKYAPGASAPTVVAKGRGLIADEIIARAREHGIFVHESPELVALLSQVDLDGQIPPQLYVAIAELLAWIYKVEREGALPAGLIAGNLG
jgi:flagellar biosynthesis protein